MELGLTESSLQLVRRCVRLQYCGGPGGGGAGAPGAERPLAQYARLLEAAGAPACSRLALHLAHLLRLWMRLAAKAGWTCLEPLLPLILKTARKSEETMNAIISYTSEDWFLLILEENFTLGQKDVVCRHLNLCLAESDPALRKHIAKVHNKYICDIAHLLISCGDFQIQVTLLENLFHFVGNPESPDCIAAAYRWFPMPKHFPARDVFLGLSFGDFDRDCRIFLNAMNQVEEKVISVQCRHVDVGNLKIFSADVRSDCDVMFWVDFNEGTQSVSFSFESLNPSPARKTNYHDVISINVNTVKSGNFVRKDEVWSLNLDLNAPPVALSKLTNSLLKDMKASLSIILDDAARMYLQKSSLLPAILKKTYNDLNTKMKIKVSCVNMHIKRYHVPSPLPVRYANKSNKMNDPPQRNLSSCKVKPAINKNQKQSCSGRIHLKKPKLPVKVSTVSMKLYNPRQVSQDSSESSNISNLPDKLKQMDEIPFSKRMARIGNSPALSKISEMTEFSQSSKALEPSDVINTASEIVSTPPIQGNVHDDNPENDINDTLLNTDVFLSEALNSMQATKPKVTSSTKPKNSISLKIPSIINKLKTDGDAGKDSDSVDLQCSKSEAVQIPSVNADVIPETQNNRLFSKDLSVELSPKCTNENSYTKKLRCRKATPKTSKFIRASKVQDKNVEISIENDLYIHKKLDVNGNTNSIENKNKSDDDFFFRENSDILNKSLYSPEMIRIINCSSDSDDFSDGLEAKKKIKENSAQFTQAIETNVPQNIAEALDRIEVNETHNSIMPKINTKNSGVDSENLEIDECNFEKEKPVASCNGKRKLFTHRDDDNLSPVDKIDEQIVPKKSMRKYQSHGASYLDIENDKKHLKSNQNQGTKSVNSKKPKFMNISKNVNYSYRKEGMKNISNYCSSEKSTNASIEKSQKGIEKINQSNEEKTPYSDLEEFNSQNYFKPKKTCKISQPTKKTRSRKSSTESSILKATPKRRKKQISRKLSYKNNNGVSKNEPVTASVDNTLNTSSNDNIIIGKENDALNFDASICANEDAIPNDSKLCHIEETNVNDVQIDTSENGKSQDTKKRKRPQSKERHVKQHIISKIYSNILLNAESNSIPINALVEKENSPIDEISIMPIENKPASDVCNENLEMRELPQRKSSRKSKLKSGIQSVRIKKNKNKKAKSSVAKSLEMHNLPEDDNLNSWVEKFFENTQPVSDMEIITDNGKVKMNSKKTQRIIKETFKTLRKKGRCMSNEIKNTLIKNINKMFSMHSLNIKKLAMDMMKSFKNVVSEFDNYTSDTIKAVEVAFNEQQEATKANDKVELKELHIKLVKLHEDEIEYHTKPKKKNI